MKQKGFTFIEILVVVGIISLFIGLSIPQLRSFQQGSQLENIGREAVVTLRLAQSKTLASQGAKQYGVYFNTESTPHEYILFEGASYATRDTNKDVVEVLQEKIEISSLQLQGGNEVVFLRLTGQASVQGSITFRLIQDPLRTKIVSILSSGAVQEGGLLSSSDEDRVIDTRHVEVSYQGRNIATASESVRLIFPDTTFPFPVVENMVNGEIFWEGDVVSEGEIQHIKVHTLLLNDPVEGTIFSIHRNRDRNTKSLNIELAEDVTGNLISYDETGIITQGTSIYVGAPEIQ